MDDHEPTKEQKAESKAKRLAEKEVFDKAGKKHCCIRCGAREVNTRFKEWTSLKGGVLDHVLWLCRDCARGLSKYLSQIHDERREAERPAREAEQARRKAALDANLAEARDSLNRQRAEKNLPPIAAPKKAAKSKPKRARASAAN